MTLYNPKPWPEGYYWISHSEGRQDSILEPALWDGKIWISPSGRVIAPNVIAPCPRAATLIHCGLAFNHMPDNNCFLVYDTAGLLCTAVSPHALAEMIKFETEHGRGSLRLSMVRDPKARAYVGSDQLAIIADMIHGLDATRADRERVQRGDFTLEDLDLDLEDLV